MMTEGRVVLLARLSLGLRLELVLGSGGVMSTGGLRMMVDSGGRGGSKSDGRAGAKDLRGLGRSCDMSTEGLGKNARANMLDL